MPAKVKAATEEAVDAVADAAAQAEEARLAARTEEDVQYEAYLGGKDAKRGNVWIAGANVASADRAALADSISAQVAEERRESGKEYAPSRAHDRRTKIKSQPGGSSSGGGGSYGGGMSLSEAREGAAAAQAALERAQQASDDDDDDDDDTSLSMTAAQLASRAMAAYNMPLSNMPQLDVYGNDLRVPQQERKLRKFLECFAEEVSISTIEGQPVLRDFEAIRKRYGTVFRESGSELRGALTKRWSFLSVTGGVEGGEGGDGADDDDDGGGGGSGYSFCIDFESHTSLVTPRPGLPLDGSMGVTPPRSQDLVVLYQAYGGELSGMWIAPDREGLGRNVAATREAVEATAVFTTFQRQLERLSGGEPMQVAFESHASST
jgi:uncharacterized membrane protein YgcG